MAVVTEHLIQPIAKQVDDHSLVSLLARNAPRCLRGEANAEGAQHVV